MNNFFKRTVTGGLFGILVYGSLFAGSIAYFFVYLFFMIAAMLEFYRLTGIRGASVQKYSALIFSSLIFALFFSVGSGILDSKWLLLMVLMPAVMIVTELYTKKGDPFDNLVWTFFGVLWIGLPVWLLNFLVFPGDLASNDYMPSIAAGVFMLIMINDSVAYLVGVPFGRHRLFERISPKKSWEGSAGGAAATLAASLLAGLLFPQLSYTVWIGIAVIVAVMGTFGDLAESLFKRGVGVKDSGDLLPGHGGILDRIDAWIFVIPVVVVYLKLIF